MNHKPFELAAKEFVKKKLWNHGYSVKKIRYSPVDLLVGEKYFVKVLYVPGNSKELFIPPDAEYADVLAVVVHHIGGYFVQYLRLGHSNTEKFVGRSLRIREFKDFIAHDFVTSPKFAFTGGPKEKAIPKEKPGIAPDDWYSVNEIARYRLMGGKQMAEKEIRALIQSKKLKASEWGEGHAKRTLIKGENIIAALAENDI